MQSWQGLDSLPQRSTASLSHHPQMGSWGSEIEMMKQSSAEAVGRAHSNGKLEAIREAAKQFQLGLQAGAQLAKGFMPRFAEDDAASDDQ